MNRVIESQLPLLVVLLVLGAVSKLAATRVGRRPDASTRFGPAILVPARLRTTALTACALGELTLAAGLLLTTWPLFRWMTVAFFALSAYVLVELRHKRPGSGCGCFGEVSSAPIGLRSIGRTITLTCMALMSAWSETPGWTSFREPSWALAAGVLLLAALSPEVEEAFHHFRYRAPCEQRPSSETLALARLKASAPWREHATNLLSHEPTDSWRELCWRFFTFDNQGDQQVVFAVYLSGLRPAVRVAVVNRESIPEYTSV